MRPVVLLVLSLCTLAVASDTIVPLFETSSVNAYDRWLWQHRDEYPGFRPIRARAGAEQSPSGWTRATAVFLTDSGTVLMRHVYSDSWDERGQVAPQVTLVNVTEDGDRLVVHHPAGNTAYDRLGRKLFDGDAHPRFNLWFRDISGKDTNAERHPWSRGVKVSDSTQVLNDEGRVVGVLPRVSVSTATGSGDTLMAAVSKSGTIVFDRRARIRWRDSLFGTASRIAAISPDGRTVAVVTRDSVGLHDLVTGSNHVLGFDTATAATARARSIVWSDDGRRAAVRYLVSRDAADSVLLRVLTRDAKEVAPPLRLESGYVDNMFWMGDTVVLVASPGEPGDKGNKMYQRGPCKAFAVTLNGGMRTWTVPGRFGRLGVWYQQGRSLAYVDKDMGYYAVFQVPVK
jgi:hypothetical protein